MGDGTKEGESRGEDSRRPSEERVSDAGTFTDTKGRSTVDDLIIQVLNGNASPFDEERLKRWREAGAENEDYFQEMNQVWALTVPEPVISASGPPSVEDIVAAAPIPLPIATTTTNGDIARKAPPWMRWGFLAASVAVAVLGIQLIRPGEPGPLQVHQVAQGPSATVTLEDGSFVRLAAGSSLEEWDAEGRREVSLEGRAFFAVARDESLPFVVRAGGSEIRVLGTRFQVDTNGDEVETVVVEGLVRVSNDEGWTEVPAGSMASVRDGEPPFAVEVEDVFSLLNWPEGTLVFHATPLAQIVAEVSRYYGRDLVLRDPGLSQRRVTAWFQGEPFEAVAESLCLVTEAVCETQSGTVSIGMGGGTE